MNTLCEALKAITTRQRKDAEELHTLKERNKMLASEIRALKEQHAITRVIIKELYQIMIRRTWISIILSGIAIVLSIVDLIIG